MTRPMPRCVYLVPALLSAAVLLTPAAATAAPFVIGQAASGCAAVGADGEGWECALFGIDPFAAGVLTGGFENGNDVALFRFTLAAQAGFQVSTSGFADTGFDPVLGLFHGAGALAGQVVQVPDPAPVPGGPTATIPLFSRDVDPDTGNFDDVLVNPWFVASTAVLLDPGVYVLALLQWGNEFREPPAGGVASLAAGFLSLDDYYGAGCDSVTCSFTLAATATPLKPTEPIPEPGTLTLLLLGSAAAGVARRKRRRCGSAPEPHS
jgi:hypothetical protein